MRRTLIGLVSIGVVLIVIGFFTELHISYERVSQTSSYSNMYTFPPSFNQSATFNVSKAESILRVSLSANSTMTVYVQLNEKVEYPPWEGSELKINYILPEAGAWVVRILNNSTVNSSHCIYFITVKEFQQVPTKPLVWLRTPLLISGGALISLSVPIHFYSELKHLFVKNKKKIEIVIAAATIIVFIFSYQIAGVILQTSTPWIVTTGASMQPTIYAGDMIIIQGSDPKNLVTGDIILFKKITEKWGEENFKTMETPVLHRIVEAFKVGDHWYYMTQGDNSPALDEWLVPDEGIIGKAILVIPKMGYVLAWLGTIEAKILLIALIIFVAFIWPSIKPKKKQSNPLEQKHETHVLIDVGV